jgi:hypothetical protein
VGADIDGMVEVFSGLALGDTVIVAGNSLVREGGQIRVVDPLAPELRTGATPAPGTPASGSADSTSITTARTTP